MTGIKARNLIIGLFLLSALLGTIQLLIQTIDQFRHPARAPLHGLAEQFTGLMPAFRGIPRAGYFTDKDPEFPVTIAQFEQAQYVLAPTVLELNNTDLPLVIFDCRSPAACLENIKRLKLMPVSVSNSGLVLAVNPKFVQR
jgi:hypothetical protein